MRFGIVIVLVALIEALEAQPVSYQSYMPKGKRIWVTVREQGGYWVNYNANIYPTVPIPYYGTPIANWYEVEGSLLIHYEKKHISIFPRLVADLALKAGQKTSITHPEPFYSSETDRCIASDTTLTTALGTFHHCKIYSKHNSDSLILAPEIGFLKDVIYAEVGDKVWGSLPEDFPIEYLEGPVFYDPDFPPTSVVVKERFPGTFALHQNYPNPFNGTTTISFELDKPGEIELSIFDIKGHKVTTLFSGFKDTGVYQVKWDAANVPSGVYFVRLPNATEHTIRKMIYTK